MSHISTILKKKRAAKGLSAKDVAAKLNVAESTYRDWENGRNIQGEPYLKISEVLDIPLGTLLGVENLDVVKILDELDEITNKVKIIRNHVRPLI